MINAITLILILLIFHLWMAMFHVVPLMECIFLNLLCSHVEGFYARNKCLTARVIGIISLERLFPVSFSDTINWFQNSMSD